MVAIIPTRYVTCRFCNGRVVGTSEGDLTKLERHMMNSHDMLFAKEFSVVLNIISQEEVESILKRLESRLTIFKDTGALEYNKNVFEDSFSVGGNTDESENESDAPNCEQERSREDSGLYDIEKQKHTIFNLLDSEEDDEDAVFQENAKHPIDKIRRLTPNLSTDREDEMARTSILSDKEIAKLCGTTYAPAL